MSITQTSNTKSRHAKHLDTPPPSPSPPLTPRNSFQACEFGSRLPQWRLWRQPLLACASRLQFHHPLRCYGETQSRAFIASLAAITSHSLHHCFLSAEYVAGVVSLLAWKTICGFRVSGSARSCGWIGAFWVRIGGGRSCFALEDRIVCVFFLCHVG
jgi:hypothetical protein